MQPEDPAIAQLQQMLTDASLLMNEAIGIETYELAWRVKLREHLFIVAKKMINDYTNRRDNHNCDPNQEIIKGPADEEDILERGLPESCREIAQPIKQLSVKQRNWRNTFNRCGDGPSRLGFNERMTKKMRKIRKRAYIQLGCPI